MDTEKKAATGGCAPTAGSPRALAEKIVTEIMRDAGVKKDAVRLVMHHEAPGYEGGGSGWGRLPLTDAIERVISENGKDHL